MTQTKADAPKRFTTTLTKNEFISPNTKLFRLDFKPGEGFNYLAGQFAMISLKDPTGKEVKRAYSFASAPFEKGHTDYCIKIVPGGAVSDPLSKMPLGSAVEIIAPYGKFVVSDFDRDLLMIAAGTGIAPFRGMIKQLLHDGFKRTIILLYGFHSEKDYLFRDELESLARKNPNLIIYPTASTPSDPAKWRFDVGRVNTIVEKYVSDANFNTFVCGPPAMVKDTVAELKKANFEDKQIHLDVWG